jgi:hypothetical protein
VSATSTDRPVFHQQRPYRGTAANWRLGPIPAVASNGVVHLPRVTFLDTLRLIALLTSLV